MGFFLSVQNGLRIHPELKHLPVVRNQNDGANILLKIGMAPPNPEVASGD